MSKRETKTIETPIDKHKIEIKTYMNGREWREIQNIYVEMANIQVGNDQNVNTEIKGNAELMTKAQDKTIEMLVISVNGKEENILDEILEMKKEDYDFILDELNKTTDLSAKKK